MIHHGYIEQLALNICLIKNAHDYGSVMGLLNELLSDEFLDE